jgi:hypothetical protein
MDGFGRTIKSEQRMGGTTYAIVETEYDAFACSPLGRLKRTYNFRNQLTGVSMPRDGYTLTRTFVYNNSGQMRRPRRRFGERRSDACLGCLGLGLRS